MHGIPVSHCQRITALNNVWVQCLGDTYCGDFSLKGAELRARGLNRVGNMLVCTPAPSLPSHALQCLMHVGLHGCLLREGLLHPRGTCLALQTSQHITRLTHQAEEEFARGGRSCAIRCQQ